ncbi:hypothetical protein SAMN05660297_03519 [Natronincola peptidivorans]|uniref:TspO and MBR related proteins n=1 Tax=Natronincola peptidivorans TaxID=426128 RepID=A0A1I0H8S1_9FIRM|nr:hypothetical protein [Natronincola peptidivorans]SET79224.1 hypothetical protein SAMN05660297_03519 [Natronincola peptidivorans]
MFSTRSLAILNAVAFIGTITMNVLANLLPINDLTTGEVSALYPNLFTPAGLTFAIWGLIYTLLGIFTFYQLVKAFRRRLYKDNFIQDIGLWNFILGLGNMIWILAWHYLYVGVSVIIMLVMLTSLIIIYRRLEIGKDTRNLKEILLVHISFSVYLGWISVATIANITAFLVAIDWQGFGISPVTWTIVVMTIAILLGLLYILKNQDIFYAAVIIWALFGIYLQRTAEGILPILAIIITSIIGMILLGIVGLAAILKRRAYIFQR